MPGTRNRGKDEEDEGENRVDEDIKCIWISWRGSSNGCIATIWKQSSSCQKGNNIQLSFPNAQRQNNSPKCATHTHTHTLACTCKSYKASRCGWRQKTNILWPSTKYCFFVDWNFSFGKWKDAQLDWDLGIWKWSQHLKLVALLLKPFLNIFALCQGPFTAERGHSHEEIQYAWKVAHHLQQH